MEDLASNVGKINGKSTGKKLGEKLSAPQEEFWRRRKWNVGEQE